MVISKFDRGDKMDPNTWLLLNATQITTPHINLDALSQSNILLDFICARTRNPPQDFAHAELLHAPCHRWTGSDLFKRHDGFVTRFIGRHQRRYGEIEQVVDARALVTAGRAMHPWTAFKVVIIQNYIYKGLTDCIMVTMQLVDRADWRKVIRPMIPSSVAATALAIALEAPYRLPATLYLDDMEPLVSAKVNELEDHIWGLREDHVYFADVCQQAFDHNSQTMKPSKGGEALALIHFPEAFKRYVLEEVVISSHRFLALWHECKQALDDVIALQSRYRKVTSD
jgi:hypothetical protein